MYLELVLPPACTGYKLPSLDSGHSEPSLGRGRGEGVPTIDKSNKPRPWPGTTTHPPHLTLGNNLHTHFMKPRRPRPRSNPSYTGNTAPAACLPVLLRGTTLQLQSWGTLGRAPFSGLIRCMTMAEVMVGWWASWWFVMQPHCQCHYPISL